MVHKKILLAIKNKEIVLQGIRNPIDQLWDIPIYKDKIMGNNYPMPSIHPGLYAAKKHSTATKPAENIAKVKVLPKDTFRQQLSQFADIIDHNILDNFLEKAAKHNKREYIKADLQPAAPSMSVIIKKKQTHADLASYLHAACFSPVRSTFSKAISKKSSKHGQD